ncbi:la-related protein 1C-like protein [Tanacetum coccineum]
MTADSSINAVNDGVNGGDSGGGGVSSPVRRRNMPSVWAQVVRGGTDSDSADPVAVGEKNVNVVVAAEIRVEGSDNGSGSGNDGIVGGVKKAAWNTSLANGGVEGSGSGSGNSVMGGGLWPALSESIGIGGKVSPPGSSELSLDGSNAVLQAPIVSQPPPPKQVKPNANYHSNTNHGKRPAKKSGSVSAGGTSSTAYNRPPPPPPLPPPPPPPFPLAGMYGNLVPAVLESPQPPFKGNNWSPRPVDPSLNRNPGRRNNYGPRPINNGYGGRRDHHGSRSPTPRDVHMQHQMGPPPPPPVRPFMRPPFMPPSLRPYGAPMGYEMGPSYVYVPTLPEPYRSGAPVLPHGAPGTMFMPRMDPPFQDPILKQIEYYFSDDNLVKDNFLRSHMDEEGWVSLTLIAGFRRVQQLTKDIQAIVNSLKNSSTVELVDDKMRRRNDWRKWIHTGSQSQTYIEEASLKNLTFEDKPSNDKEEVGPSSSLKLPNGEVSSEEPSS